MSSPNSWARRCRVTFINTVPAIQRKAFDGACEATLTRNEDSTETSEGGYLNPTAEPFRLLLYGSDLLAMGELVLRRKRFLKIGGRRPQCPVPF